MRSTSCTTKAIIALFLLCFACFSLRRCFRQTSLSQSVNLLNTCQVDHRQLWLHLSCLLLSLLFLPSLLPFKAALLKQQQHHYHHHHQLCLHPIKISLLFLLSTHNASVHTRHLSRRVWAFLWRATGLCRRRKE